MGVVVSALAPNHQPQKSISCNNILGQGKLKQQIELGVVFVEADVWATRSEIMQNIWFTCKDWAMRHVDDSVPGSGVQSTGMKSMEWKLWAFKSELLL